MGAEAAPALLYLPVLPGPGSSIELPSDAAHYVARVCRGRVGETVEATDGQGARAVIRLTRVREGVGAEVVSIVREVPGPRAWVLCGPPEGERADWLVEKLAEFGVERFQPVDCERGSWNRAGVRRARWARLAEAAMRQSRRTRLMTVSVPLAIEQALESLPEGSDRWLTDESGGAPIAEAGRSSGLAVVLVGPAGGLTERERNVATQAGFTPVRLARARLRTETAALAWAARWTGSTG